MAAWIWGVTEWKAADRLDFGFAIFNLQWVQGTQG